MKLRSALPLLALLAACSDGPTGPEPVRQLDILAGTELVDSRTLALGATLRLSTELRDASGKPLSGRSVGWRSTDLLVATVDTLGLVTAVGPGDAMVIAAAERAADTVRIRVEAPAQGAPQCAPGEAGLKLAVGQVYATDANASSTLCIAGGEGQEFVLVPFHQAATGTMRFEVEAAGVTSVTGGPTPARAPTGAASLLTTAGLSERGLHPLHARLRALEREIRPSLSRGMLAPSPSLAAAAVPSVGDTLQLNGSDQYCPATRIPATVEAVSARAVIAADVANPAGGFTRAEYQEFAAAFDAVVWPTLTETFGAPGDMDANQRVLIFFTKEVNRLSDASGVVLGFYHPRDLDASCTNGNRGEVLYMMVPDSARTDMLAAGFTKPRVKSSTVTTIGHELQHLINYSRRLQRGAAGEQVWLNEGLSHIAEELLFFRAAGLGPEMELDMEVLRRTPGALDAINAYHLVNLGGRYAPYLRSPSANGPIDSDDDVQTRGAVWSFLRYAADRKTDPAGQARFWFDLANSSASGLANLRQALGADPLEWMRDWSVSTYADDVVPLAPQYRQPSWNLRDIIGSLRNSSGQQAYPQYPLAVQTLANAAAAGPSSISLTAGGAAYLRFGVAAGERAAVRTLSGGTTAPASLKLSLVRTR